MNRILNNIRKMETREVKDIYKHIKRDFPPGEYAPYMILHRQIKKGIQEGLIYSIDGIDSAYSICSSGRANGHVLLSLFAVYEEFRGKGIGSNFLKEITKVYSERQSIIVEVEKPEDAKSGEERSSRERRIEFYKRAGFYLIPGIDYTIWDVPMHLMAYPVLLPAEKINQEIKQIMYDIYLQLMGQMFIHKLVFK